jgi:rRNA maturation endonuclease Nob1
VSKMKEYLLAKYEEGEICLACSQSYPPNGILFCDDCGMDKDIQQQKEREGDNV